ncbi:MAG TPA: tRNA dihydrouridine(16) synthase DusC [Alteromonas sp.]|jgi:tRNA-dihydrouridine synthase C|nr:tRNA dihydrouridine(16) synthase DusC [Alteromonas sp.]HCB09466.1 tRNA dihydrouridine(16) synthase DusC [Alteromonas sp.]HCB17537.1 tRNA dihydrouridine(16) synthase DusC [Alteromonas sp.]HCL10667.1 tRNA dihydrouridine(16) synthase DusC [Alteromonas sp.]HCV16704.1 tRNA dihydrouridine(16) synthase DusC [Alteromonas sp.]|tara:strand:+ start:2097 stop:3041 length:945 start_codon:yes stop_codon:yes gene_type:complete
MRVLLAPMEGVVDHLMRDMLTRVGGFDLCVTEFVRIVDQKLPQKTFYRLCPELHEGGKTPSGVPVRVQLLGQHPQWLAENALTAVELGSPGVDLNFGCPAKTVNKSKGGAVLLQYTELLHDIVKAVREAVPAHLPVTAKIRLGFEDKSLAIDNAVAIDEAGASELVVHARTKTEGYRPPAYWDWIKKIRANTRLPVIANGEIWTYEDARRCQEMSGCNDVMIGRGALAMPNLARHIRDNEAPMSWPELAQLLIDYSGYEIYGDKGRYYPNRLKQWCGYLKRQYPQAEVLFDNIRRLQKADEIVAVLQQSAAAAK